MTRRLLTLLGLTGALLFSGVIVDSPAPAAGAAMLPAAVPVPSRAPTPLFDLRLGEGIVQVRIRACEACRTEVSIRLELPGFAARLVAR